MLDFLRRNVASKVGDLQMDFELAAQESGFFARHPQLSFGGGAGVIFLFALATELSGTPTFKIYLISGIGYLTETEE